MVANAGLASFTRQGATRVVLIAHKVDIAIGACACATPHTRGRLILDLHVEVGSMVDRWRADDFPESPLRLTPWTCPLDPSIATHRPAQVPLVAHLIHSPELGGLGL